jgi:hypothetical protein
VSGWAHLTSCGSAPVQAHSRSLKGATALLARDLGVRARLDADVYRNVARGVAEADLRRAVAADLGDWFRFEVRPGSVIGGSAVRLPVTSLVGVTTWVAFHVDLVGTDLRMTSHPDDVPPLARGVIPEVTQRGYRAYPLVDHVADKIAATYDRYGVARLPSTRYRDLVDLVAIVRAGSVAALDQRTALQSEFERRGLVLPDRFEPPDRRAWERGYAAAARRSLHKRLERSEKRASRLRESDRQSVVYAAGAMLAIPRWSKRVCMLIRRVS